MDPRLAALLFAALACGAQQTRIARVVDIAPVWAGHPVSFDLLTHNDRQYVAFYDAEKRMTVGVRTLDSRRWDLVRLPSQLGWDSHNYVTMAIDRDGHIHLSGNMHVHPLVYFRTTKPGDIHSFERVPTMVGRNEDRCTYPRFLRTPAGDLVFTYRDGRSGAGNQVFNVYDEKARSWRRLMDQPLTDGQGRMNAYFHGPAPGPDGYFHLVWMWRDTPDCVTNHDLSYARSKDLVHWETSAGKPLALPITLETAEIIDPVPSGGGMINSNMRIGFDSRNRVIVTYHKFDRAGNTQIMNARLENGAWKIYQTSDWTYRWDFKGPGTVVVEISHGAVRVAPDGGLRLDYEHIRYGQDTWKLDERTLKPVATLPRERPWPAELERPESPFPGIQVHIQPDSGKPPGQARYFLRWETLGPNRDRPRQGPLPEPSMLRLYEIRGPENTIRLYGEVSTDARVYRPLDTVTVRVKGRSKGDTACRIRAADPEQRTYFEAEVPLVDNRGEARFTATGPLGTHYIYLTWSGERRYSRYVNFRLDAETGIESGDRDFDALFPFTRDSMLLGRREYHTPRGKFVGYISADTWHFDGIWLRDWIYQLPAYKYWERDMSCGIDRFLEAQREDGQVPDGIERNGKTWRVGLESDVEYIMTLAVWQTWQVTGDNAWLAQALPRLERALRYIMSDPKHWDPVNRLIKRQHSCDTWDYDIEGASDKGVSRHVIATCDQSGYELAFRAMALMYRRLGRAQDAERWERDAAEYRKRAASLLWDGTKFLHHVHLDPIDHGDFDERRQLAMSNTWAMTRGLATPEQSMRIIDEYRRRQTETGDAYPWWSLQPGYPDHLGYWKEPFRKQGGYANGGLMPWVGGELCRAAFLFGRESYGLELLRQWADHLRRTGGAHVWYWPNGEPGFRTTNEVNYAGWGMAQWLDALIEGLAGIRDAAGQMRSMQISPRWAAAPVNEVRATARHALTNNYFAYRMRLRRDRPAIELDYSGSGESADFRVLLPAGWKPAAVSVDGRETPFALERAGESYYVAFRAPSAVRGSIVVNAAR